MESAKETSQEEDMGVRCLELLGFKEYIGREIPVTVDGNQKLIQAEDFLKVCGQHATPAFIGLESMDPQDPNYPVAFGVFRDLAAHYLGADIPKEA